MAKTPNNNDGNTMHIGQAIQQLLNSYHIKAKFDEANLISSWERMVGKPIAKRTKKVFVRNKVLFVELESPSMKSELSFHKKEMITLFQKEFGKDIIHEIVII
jgi:predicted nucleic acid-binding Zn ribbon protein